VDQSTIPLREFLESKHGELVRGLEDIKDLQRITNGRVRSAEVKIAILQVGYALGGFLAAAWFFEWIKR
jgi:hypothetical protein